MDSVERKMQISNIITAYQMDIITYMEAHERMMDLFNSVNHIGIRQFNLN